MCTTCVVASQTFPVSGLGSHCHSTNTLMATPGHPSETCSHLERLSATPLLADLTACKQACVVDPRCFHVYWQTAHDLGKPPTEEGNTMCQLYQSCVLPTRGNGTGTNFGK